MRQAGQIVLVEFPQADLHEGKMRPALLLCKLPDKFDDWLICMISGQMRTYNDQFDEIMQENDPEFSGSGLKKASVIRVGRLAVVDSQVTIGAIGIIAPERLQRIKQRLASWLLQS